MTRDLTTTTPRPPAPSAQGPLGKGIGRALANSEASYLAPIDFNPIPWERRMDIATVADEAHRGRVSLRTWRLAQDVAPSLPTVEEVDRWAQELSTAAAAEPDRTATRAMIAMLLDAYPSGRPANLAAYADTLLHDTMRLGYAPHVVALACRDVRSEHKFLPAVAEWVSALAAAKELWSLLQRNADFMRERVALIHAVSDSPEPEPARWERGQPMEGGERGAS